MADLALSFRDRFLDEAVQSLERRRKTLASRGELRVSSDLADGLERATMVYTSGNSPAVVLALTAGLRADVYLCSSQPRHPGKVLMQVERLSLAADVKRLLVAFEWTIAAVRRLEPDGQSLDTGHLSEIARRWRALGTGGVFS